ncbi:hypothetical protein RJ641_027006 [Dillenia turbinata]|uniref:Uncharacterized protein n=1 Tax=Dillenia turbinata TaxID=194707 RepID=A0AAN8W1L5_9MAGN
MDGFEEFCMEGLNWARCEDESRRRRFRMGDYFYPFIELKASLMKFEGCYHLQDALWSGLACSNIHCIESLGKCSAHHQTKVLQEYFPFAYRLGEVKGKVSISSTSRICYNYTKQTTNEFGWRLALQRLPIFEFQEKGHMPKMLVGVEMVEQDQLDGKLVTGFALGGVVVNTTMLTGQNATNANNQEIIAVKFEGSTSGKTA